MNQENGMKGAKTVAYCLISAPFDRVKLLLQNQGELLLTNRLDHGYCGIVDCAARIYMEEGLLSLWNVSAISFISSVSAHLLGYIAIQAVNQIVRVDTEDSTLMISLKSLLSNILTGSLPLVVLYPLNLSKTRLATNVKYSKVSKEKPFKGIIDIYSKIFKTDGLRGLYRGFGTACLGVIVYRCCYFGLQSTLTPLLRSSSYANSALAESMLASGITITSGLISYPLDTICNRMMIRSGECIGKYHNCVECGHEIVSHEGFFSLYRGLDLLIIKGILGIVLFSGIKRKW